MLNNGIILPLNNILKNNNNQKKVIKQFNRLIDFKKNCVIRFFVVKIYGLTNKDFYL